MRLIYADALAAVFSERGRKYREEHSYSKAREADAAQCIVYSAPTIEAIPIDVLKHELAGIAAADQCDQGSSYDRELERAIKTVLKWRESPAYQMRLESMRRFGWKV